MSISSLQALVLAAGKSTGFKTGKTKLIEKVCGQEIILYTTRLLQSMHIKASVIIGYQKELITAIVQKKHADLFTFIEQQEQHTVIDSIIHASTQQSQEHVLIMHADMPLITQELIEALYKKHLETNATITLATSHVINPQDSQYGRVIKKNNTVTLTQPSEIQDDLGEHCCIDASVYLVKKSFLEKHALTLQKECTNQEWYMHELIHIANEYKEPVATVAVPFDTIRGINTLQELWAVEQIKRSELIRYWMDRGVRFSAAQNVHIDLNINIGTGSFIGCGAHIIGHSVIGQNSSIMEFSTVEDSIVGDNVLVEPHSIIRNSTIHHNVTVGPFAHIRNQSEIHEHTHIGNFVEIKKSTVAHHTNAKHLAYIGDTTIEHHVNIGAGTVICNYDGQNKHETTIKEHAFIGSNSTLIAPITIEKNAYVAAGSTVTESVPENALAIARSRQVNKNDYALLLKKKKAQKLTNSDDSFIPAKKAQYPPNIQNN